MKLFRLVRRATHLLSQRERQTLVLISIGQIVTGFLDIFGVLLLGLVAVLSASALAGSPLPDSLDNALRLSGLENFSTETTIGLVCLLAALALMCKSGLNLVFAKFIYHYLAKRQAGITERLAVSLFSRPLSDIQKRNSNDVAFIIIRGTNAAVTGILAPATILLSDLSLLLLFGITLAFIDTAAAVTAILFFGLVAVTLDKRLATRARLIGERGADYDIRGYRAVREMLFAYRELFVSNRRVDYINKLTDLRRRAAINTASSQFLSVMPRFVFEIALVLGGILLILTQLTDNSLTTAIGVLGIFLAAAARIMPSILRAQTTLLSIRTSAAPAQMTLDFIEDLSESVEKETQRPLMAQQSPSVADLETFTPSLHVHNLSFSYPESDSEALSNVSFSCEAGSSIALVGVTGAGKSTLADLLLGVAEPNSGRVLIGGEKPAVAVTKWPGQIAYVPQQVFLIHGTIRENLALGLPPGAMPDTEFWAALEKAQLADFLRVQREGLDTAVGEDGIKLSGGQRQRLGLARALVTRPKFIVLDEATSALDAETERSVARAIDSFRGSITTVVIAHRLGTLKHSNLVVFLDHGKASVFSSFDEARKNSPGFRRQAELLGL